MAPAAADIEDEIKNEKNPPPLDEDDIALLKTYGLGPYSTSIKNVEKEIKEMAKKVVNDLCGIKESGTGLAVPSQWDLVSDKQMMQEEQPLQGSIFTRDINKAILISDATETGTVQINSAPARGPDHFPFQGLKDSGIGSQGITNSINMMTKIKSTIINLPTPSYTID